MKYKTKKEFKKANIFGTGIYNFLFARNMTGKTYTKPIRMKNNLMLFNVSFEPGARCFWHIHRGKNGGGQIILCTAGEGWYQEEGKPPMELKPGDSVYIPTDLKHWHGAKKDTWFSHIAIEISGDDVKNEFIEPVDQEYYSSLNDGEVTITTPMFKKGYPNDMFAQYFKGNSYLNPLTNPETCPVFVANVTFEPGCRNNWHIHESSDKGGQILICTDGEGWYQEENKKVKSLKPGDVVEIKPNVKHWHGAKKDSWFSHVSVEIPAQNGKTVWLDEVSDEYYQKL